MDAAGRGWLSGWLCFSKQTPNKRHRLSDRLTLLHRRRIGNPALPENRLLVWRGRQLPGPGRRWAHFCVHMHVEQIRLVGLDRMLERAPEILRPGDGRRLDAARARPGGKVRI